MSFFPIFFHYSRVMRVSNGPWSVTLVRKRGVHYGFYKDNWATRVVADDEVSRSPCTAFCMPSLQPIQYSTQQWKRCVCIYTSSRHHSRHYHHHHNSRRTHISYTLPKLLSHLHKLTCPTPPLKLSNIHVQYSSSVSFPSHTLSLHNSTTWYGRQMG